MMRWLVSLCLRNKAMCLALAILAVVVGARVTPTIPLDVFPEFAPVRVEIQTEAPGLSTAQIESLVTIPIENAINGAPFLKKLRSKSVLGLSSVVLLFEDNTDLMVARQQVQERLASVATRLPVIAKAPVILPPLSSTSRILKIGISSGEIPRTELTRLARFTVRPRLTAIPGVANVAIWGEEVRQLQVLVDPDRLRVHGIPLADVVTTARQALAPEAGGFIDTPNQRLAVVHAQAVLDASDLAGMAVVNRAGAPVLLGEVTEVVDGHATMIGDAVIDDRPGLLLIVEKQPWGNTLEITRKVEEALANLRPALPGVDVDSTIFRPATFIEMSIGNLEAALVIGCLLVVAVLLLFLFDWRTALISAVAIPLSLVAALIVLYYRGGTLNTMALAGLIIALGEIVDDAIIDVENIVRRLELNREANSPRTAFSVVLEASLEVRSAVVYGSLVVVVALAPVFFLDGLSGAFFRPLATSYILAIASSLLVALTVTPVLCLLLLQNRSSSGRGSPVTRFLRSHYRQMLEQLIGRGRGALACAVVTIAAALSILPFLGEELLPDFKEYDFLMHWVEKPATSLEAMQRITLRASRDLRSIEGVRNFGAHIGRAEVADEVVGPNFTELWISLDPEVDYSATVAKVQAVVDSYPGLYRDLLTYLKERIKEVLSGASASIVVRTYGSDLASLRLRADAVAMSLSQVEGVVDLHVEQQVLVPQVVIRPIPAAARRYGVSPMRVRNAAGTLLNGTVVGQVYGDQEFFDVAVWGSESVRGSVESVHSIMVDTEAGARVPLRELARVTVEPTPNVIQREDASRRIDVTCNVRGRDLGATAREIEQRVAELPAVEGYHSEVLGEYAEQRRSRNRMVLVSVIAGMGILLILYSDFSSLRWTLLLALSLLFSLAGGVAAVILSGGVFSLGSIVGFVTVLGITARNGIMLFSHYRHLRAHEGFHFGRELAMRGAEERLAPILMTSLTTVFALLPIVIAGSLPGQEIEHPMAIVIVGGLMVSTPMNLLLMPPLFLRFSETPARSKA